MPNSSNVDEQVIQMRMDDEQFQKGAERTIGTLGRLKKSMEFENTKVGGLDFGPLEQSVEKIGDKISMTFSAKKRVIENMIDGVVNTFKRAVNSIDNISPGYQKYESQIEAVQKLMIATGESMDNVQKMSDKILAFTDETSYDYSSMLSTLSQFSTAGVGLEDAQNTIIGLAVAAGQAGVNASQASHAFMGFQKAMSQGYMGSNQWDWIKTAGMNTIELQQALINAAVAEGKLRDAGNGIYYAQQQTAKGVKEIEVTVENMGNTFASKWLSKEAMVKAASNYAKAFNQIYEIADREDLAIWQVIDDSSPYLNQLDQYSLAAFKAGQETKTWSDAVNALKSTISSGWMKSFELIIGNYKQASGFFTDIIEPLYTLFTGAGSKRNSFLEAAFGSPNDTEASARAVSEATVSWEKLIKKLEETEHSTDELETAFRKVAESDDQVRALTSEYGSLEEAIKSGAVSGDLLKRILNEITGITTETSEAVADTAASYQQYLETAWAVLRGDYGNGEERRKALEEMGMDYEMIQWLAGNLANGMTMDTLTLDWIAQVAPNHYQQFIEILGQTGAAAEAAGQEFIDLADVVHEADVVSETAGLSVREIWQNSVTNILTGVADAITAIGDAFDDVFGDAKTRGEGFRGWMNRIYEATKGFEISSDIIEKIKEKATSFFTVIKENSGSVLNFLKMGIQNAGKAFGVFRKGAKLAVGILRDLFGWVKKLFSGRFELPENLQNSESLLAKIAKWLLDIFNKTREFMDTVLTGGGIWSFLEKGLDKIQEIWDKLKSGQGLGSIIRETFGSLFSFGEGEEPKGILGFFSRLFGGFKKDSDEMSDGLLTITDSMDGVSDSVRGLDRAMTGMTNVLEPVSNLIFGDPAELENKITGLWDSIKKVFVNEYGKIKWDALLDIGKFGLFGFLIYKVNDFFNSLKGTVKKGSAQLGSIRGLIASVQGISDSIQSPFKAMSKAITNKEKADRYLKIAAAIGILAGSIYLLTQVDEQKFFNVAVTLGLLMLIMSRMAKNMDGFQLFSNNVKQISKNNQNTPQLLNNLAGSLKNILSLDLSNFQGKFKINVFSEVAQTILAVAALIGVIVFAILKLKDIAKPDQLEQLWPTLAIIGGTMVLITGLVAIMAGVTKNSKYLGKAGWVILTMAASLLIIVSAIKSIASAVNTNGYGAIIMSLAVIVAIMAMIGLVMLAAGKMVHQGGVLVSGGGSILAIAGVFLSIGILIRSLVKSISKASEIENLTKGLAIVVSLFLGIIVVLTILGALVNNDTNATNMLKVAGSMAILALAVLVLTPAIMAMSKFPAAGLLAAAGALSIMVVAMSGAIWILSKVPVGKLLVAAVVFGVIAAAIGLLVAASGIFVSTMIDLVQTIPWDQMTKKLNDFKLAMQIILPTLWQLAAISIITGAGVFLLGTGILAVGAAFTLAAVGILIGAYAIKVLGSALTSVGEGLPAFVQGLVNLYDTVDQNGWKVIVVLIGLVALALLIVKVVKSIDFGSLITKLGTFGGNVVQTLEKLIEVIRLMAPKFINLILSIIAMFLTALIAMMPILSDKLVKLIVSLINSVAESIRTHRQEIIGAFGNLLSALFELLLTAIGEVAGSIGGGIMGLLKKIFPEDKYDFWGGYSGMSAKETANAAYGEVYGFFDQSADAMASFTRGKGEEVGEALKDGIVEGARSRPGQTTTYLEPIQEQLEQEAETVGDEVGPKIADSIEESTKTALTGDDTAEGAAESAGGWVGAITDTFGDMGNFLPLDDMKESMSGVLGGEDMMQMFSTGGEDGAKSYVGGLDGLFNGDYTSGILSTDGSNLFGMIGGSFMTETNTNVSGLAENLVNGIHNWIVEHAGNVLPSAGRYMYTQVQTGVEDAGVIASPSKEMGKEGMWMVLGLAKGIYDNADTAYTAGSDTATGLIDEFRQTMEKVALIASDDFDFSPTITPVVDLSKVHEAAGLMNGTFGEGYRIPTSLTGSINRRMNDIERVASGMESRQQAINNNSNDIITFNIYASEGMDENAIADAVMERMGSRYARRGMAYG